MTTNEFKEKYRYNGGDVEVCKGKFDGIRNCWGESAEGHFCQCIYKGDKIIKDGFEDFKPICNDRLLHITWCKNGESAPEYELSKSLTVIIDNKGNVVVDENDKTSIQGFLVPGQQYNEDATHWIITVGGILFKVVNDGIEQIEVNGVPAIMATGTGGKYCMCLYFFDSESSSKKNAIIGKDYKEIPEGYLFDKISTGPFIGTSVLTESSTGNSIIVDYCSGQCFPDLPGKIYEPKECITGIPYIIAKFHPKDSSTDEIKIYERDYSSSRVEEIGEEYTFTKCFEDPDYKLFVMKAEDDDNLYIVNGRIIEPCKEYRLSGEILSSDETSIQKKNNIIYIYDGKSWKMKPLHRYRDVENSDNRFIYDGDFDSVECLGCRMNIIRKGDKEHFVDDVLGFYPKSNSEEFWFDECYPFNDDSPFEPYYMQIVGRKGDKKYRIIRDINNDWALKEID